MTSEPDSNPGRRPPTIELKATEVSPPVSPAEGSGSTPGDSAGSKTSDEAAPSPQAAGRMKLHAGETVVGAAVGAVVGAIVTAAILAGLWFAGEMPSRETAAPMVATTPQSAAPDVGPEISARLDKIERTVNAQQQSATSAAAPALAKQLAATEAQQKSLGDSLTAFNRRLDDIAAKSQSAAKDAAAAQTTAEAAKTASQSATQTDIQRSDLDALANRIAALEATVKALAEKAAQPASGADDPAARLTIATAALRDAVESGAPYQSELAAVQSLGVAPDTTAPLQSSAATGLPSAAALGGELASLVPALQRVSETPSGGGSFLERLEAHAQQLVQVTPVDAPAGNDPASVIARIEIDAGHADIAAALNDIAALPDSAKPLAAAWVAKAKAREAAVATSRQIAAAALSAMGKPASQ